jgi:UDP-glucose 4-epimerase
VILVVGGAGYIGSHLVKLLRNTGEEHLVFDNFEQGHEEALKGSRFFKGDLRDESSLQQCFDLNPSIDLVMHFAAYISVGESEKLPYKYWRNNTAGVLNLLKSMEDHKVQHLVFSSTAAIFGEPQYVPVDEEHPKNPTSCYGDTKLAVERMLADFDRASGIKSVCLRYFNAAGADPSGDIGEDHHPEEHLIPLAISAVMGRRPKLKVFGSDWDTEDGTCVRDYVHVLDLAQAHLMAVKHLRGGGDSSHYNLGNGVGFSVKQVLDEVSAVAGKPVPWENAPRRPGDPAKLIASAAKIRGDWGWAPEFPELSTIVEHAWGWHKNHPFGYSREDL